MTHVKICGVTKPEHALAAAEAGAHFVGLVFAQSRRQVSVAQARAIVASLGGGQPSPLAAPESWADVGDWFRRCAEGVEALLAARRPLTVGVFADQDADFINTVADECGLDLVQISGGEGWEFCRRLNRPVIRVVHVGSSTSGSDILDGVRAGFAHLCLLDTQVEGAQGGSGRTFDWTVAQPVAQHIPIVLAGGLTPENVGRAVRQVRPWAVDVSSGVETEGVKDEDRIRAFVVAAQGAGGP